MLKYDPNAWEKLGDKFTNNYEAGLLDYRMNIIRTVVGYQHNCQNMLDIACADGWFCQQMRNHGLEIHYVGIDITPNLIERARKRMPDEIFAIHDAMKLPDGHDGDFDFVLCAGILMHLPNYKKGISEACRVANKYVMFSTYGTFKPTGYGVNEEDSAFINNVYSMREIMRVVPKEFKLIEFNAFQRTPNFNIFQYLYMRVDLP